MIEHIKQNHAAGYMNGNQVQVLSIKKGETNRWYPIVLTELPDGGHIVSRVSIDERGLLHVRSIVVTQPQSSRSLRPLVRFKLSMLNWTGDIITNSDHGSVNWTCTRFVEHLRNEQGEDQKFSPKYSIDSFSSLIIPSDHICKYGDHASLRVTLL